MSIESVAKGFRNKEFLPSEITKILLKNKFKISKKDIYSEALKKWGSK